MMRSFMRSALGQLRYYVTKSMLTKQLNPGGTIDVSQSMKGFVTKLKASGIGDVDFNIKCLMAYVLKMKFKDLKNLDTIQLDAGQYKEFQRLIEARCARVPLQYIVGEWDFMNLTLKMAPTVFIPRPETEEFVRKVIEKYRMAESVSMLEVGCGSGAISLAILASLPNVHAIAIECSRIAVDLAKRNTGLLGLGDRLTIYNHTMEKSRYLPDELQDKEFDVIIANPPYVKKSEMRLLQPEILLYENLKALDGGPDGLNVARLICDLAVEHLRTDGSLWMELGRDQPQLMKTIITMRYKKKLSFTAVHKDQNKVDRFVEILKL